MSKISALQEILLQSKITQGEQLKSDADQRSSDLIITETGAKAMSSLTSETTEIDESRTVKLTTKIIYNLRNLINKPIYFLVFTLARFSVIRRIYSFCLNLVSPSATINQVQDSLFELDPISTVETLKQEGVCAGLDLPESFLAELQQYLLTQDCYAGGKSHLGFKISEKQELDRVFQKPFYVARYYNLSTKCPQIARLVNDSKLQQIATGYVGQQAQYMGASLFWTFPIEGESVDADQQMFSHFHYDIDDFAGLRFCFYLTDVTLNDGPHVCIRGSHIQKRIHHMLNFFSRIQTAAELKNTYGLEKFMTISGDAGSGFMEDTFCFHKGNPPKDQPRLFLQLHFATHNYCQGKYLDDRDPATLHSWRESLSSN